MGDFYSGGFGNYLGNTNQQFGGASLLGGQGGGQSSGGMDWMKLLGGGGNPLATLGLTFGPPLLSALGSLFGGKSQSQKNSQNVFNLASGMRGKQVFDPNAIFGKLQQGLQPTFAADAEAVSKRLGLSSGVAQGELAGRRHSMLSELFGKIQMESLQAQSQRDLQLLQIMLGASAGS